MNILPERFNAAVVGSGGRELIYVVKLNESPRVIKTFVIPGTDGFRDFAEVIGIKTHDFLGIKRAVLENSIKLIIVGPEDPLIGGIVDFVQNDPDLQAAEVRIYGPKRAAAELEGSKSFTAILCREEGIPAPKTFFYSDVADIENDLAILVRELSGYPIVLKVSGPALGKGARVCESRGEVMDFLDEIKTGKFGKSADIILVQEYIEGIEASIIVALGANEDRLVMRHTQDYKLVEKGSRYMTGGMGSFGPAASVAPEVEKRVMEKINNPLLNAMKKKGRPYVGFIYEGIMIKPDEEPVLLEVNARNGDPEAEVNIALLDTDFIEVIEAAFDGKLNEVEVKWKSKKCICLILTSRGYGLPSGYKTGFPVTGIEEARKMGVIVLPYGVKSDGKGGYLTDGGRVMALIALEDTFAEAQSKVYAAREKIICENLTCRPDIGDEAVEWERRR